MLVAFESWAQRVMFSIVREHCCSFYKLDPCPVSIYSFAALSKAAIITNWGRTEALTTLGQCNMHAIINQKRKAAVVEQPIWMRMTCSVQAAPERTFLRALCDTQCMNATLWFIEFAGWKSSWTDLSTHSTYYAYQQYTTWRRQNVKWKLENMQYKGERTKAWVSENAAAV